MSSWSWMLINVLSTAMEIQFANGYAQDPSKQKDVTEYIKTLVDKTDGAIIMGFFNATRAQKGNMMWEKQKNLHRNKLYDDDQFCRS